MMRRRWLIVVGAAVLAGAFYAGLRWGHEQRSRLADGGSNTRAVPTSAVPGAAQRKIESLPADPTHMLRATEYAALHDASARGDADAAYRLARAAQACFELRGLRAFPEPAPSEEEESRRVRVATLSAECIGDDRVGMRAVHGMWREAARLGSREAQFHYAANPIFNPLALAGEDFDELRDWHDHAPAYLESAAAAGDARAALVLALASDANRSQFARLEDATEVTDGGQVLALIRAQDAALAYRYYALDAFLDDATNRARVGAAMARLTSGMTEGQIRQALQWAQDAQLRIRRGTPPG